jgi:hypothetical protein
MILGPHTITRLRATSAVDPYSGEATGEDWSIPNELPIPGCSVQPGPGQPLLRNLRAGVIVDYIAWAPLDTDVTEHDRIRYAGQDYDVSDTIQRWDFTGLGHLVIPMRRVEG